MPVTLFPCLSSYRLALSVYVCACNSLHLGKAFCIMSCCYLFLCCCCSFLTHDNSLLFISLCTSLATFCGCIECLCVCLLSSLCILVRLSASCHVMTCFFVVVVHFSLMTTLFCFISLGSLLATFLWLY